MGESPQPSSNRHHQVTPALDAPPTTVEPVAHHRNNSRAPDVTESILDTASIRVIKDVISEFPKGENWSQRAPVAEA